MPLVEEMYNKLLGTIIRHLKIFLASCPGTTFRYSEI